MRKGLNQRKYKSLLTAFAVIAFAVVLCLFAGACTDNKENVFDDAEISEWKKQNKSIGNKHVLNGGYYIHFNGVNYPVVFESGSIIRFDNMPDELFFLTMFELYTDPNLKNRCAYLASYEESYIIDDEIWNGYILDGKRPKLGSVLYLNENDERKFIFTLDDMNNSAPLGPDDIINMKNGPQSLRLNEHRLWIHFSDSTGKVYDLINTPRKLYNYIKKQPGVEFDARVSYTYVAYPSAVFDMYDYYYDYNNKLINGSMFREELLQNSKESACCFLVNKHKLYNDYAEESLVLDFWVNYERFGYEKELYQVVLTHAAEPSFRENIENHDGNWYSDIVKNDDGQIISYQNNTNYCAKVNVFYGTLEEFDAFLRQNAPVDYEQLEAVTHFSFKTDGESFIRGENEYDELVYVRISDKNTLHAVWHDCKKVMLHEDGSAIYLCMGQESDLPKPQRGGYEFAGWYAASDFTGPRIEKVSYDDEYTDLYPKFEKADYYTLTFEPHDGQNLEDVVYSYGDEVQLPVLTKAFYVFEGWCTDSECKTEPMEFISSNFSGSYHLYPCFSPREYTITIISGDTINTVKVKYGESFVLPIDKGFLGYYDVDGIRYTDENGNSLAPFTDGVDIQLFAKYIAEDISK